MKVQLNNVGLSNVEVLPNFKPIGELPAKRNRPTGGIKFVFLGRLIEEKGVGLLIDASRKLYEEYGKKFSVTFYGSQTNTYSQGYFDTLDCDNISYGGFLNLKSKEGLKQLSEYDVMVFPTYFEGEGFPGVLIDAFKAGLPVIASDFHANPDVISNPALGVLIKPKDVDSLKSAMLGFIENPSRIPSMSMAVQKDVCKYDIDKVLNKENINRIFENDTKQTFAMGRFSQWMAHDTCSFRACHAIGNARWVFHNHLWNMIYSFHMPAFMTVSGYFAYRVHRNGGANRCALDDSFN